MFDTRSGADDPEKGFSFGCLVKVTGETNTTLSATIVKREVYTTKPVATTSTDREH